MMTQVSLFEWFEVVTDLHGGKHEIVFEYDPSTWTERDKRVSTDYLDLGARANVAMWDENGVPV